MLSLLSLIIASGTVLRADTELWDPSTYPDPRTNSTECNVPYEGTLCDPDHILTDTWRQTILDNIAAHVSRLQTAKIQYTSDASEECHSNQTDGVQLYMILAKRIHSSSNQSITSNDLTHFGHGLRESFGLDSMPCKNYVLILGVELAKQIYVWTGSDLAIPKDQLDASLSQYKNLFIERNYMEGLNKIVEEITSLLLDPFKEISTTTASVDSTEYASTTVESTTEHVDYKQVIPVWMYVVIAVCVCVTTFIVVLFAISIARHFSHRSTMHISKTNKQPKLTARDEEGEQRHFSFSCGSVPRISRVSPTTTQIPQHRRNDSLTSFDDRSPPVKQLIVDEQSAIVTKLDVTDARLLTDRVVARRNSETKPTLDIGEDQFSSL